MYLTIQMSLKNIGPGAKCHLLLISPGSPQCGAHRRPQELTACNWTVHRPLAPASEETQSEAALRSPGWRPPQLAAWLAAAWVAGSMLAPPCVRGRKRKRNPWEDVGETADRACALSPRHEGSHEAGNSYMNRKWWLIKWHRMNEFMNKWICLILVH